VSDRVPNEPGRCAALAGRRVPRRAVGPAAWGFYRSHPDLCGLDNKWEQRASLSICFRSDTLASIPSRMSPAQWTRYWSTHVEDKRVVRKLQFPNKSKIKQRPTDTLLNYLEDLCADGVITLDTPARETLKANVLEKKYQTVNIAPDFSLKCTLPGAEAADLDARKALKPRAAAMIQNGLIVALSLP